MGWRLGKKGDAEFILPHIIDGPSNRSEIKRRFRDKIEIVKVRPDFIKAITKGRGVFSLYHSKLSIIVPKGWEARTYKFTNTGGNTTVSVSHTYYSGEVIPKGTGVLFRSIEPKFPEFFRAELTDRSEFIDTENDLKGFNDERTFPKVGYIEYSYKLGSNGVVSWYPEDNHELRWRGPYRTYLLLKSDK